MYRLLTYGVQRTNLNHFQTFLLTLPLILMEITILLVFTFIDPPEQTEYLGTGTKNDNLNGMTQMHNAYQQVTCEHRTNTFFITQFVFDGKQESGTI
jgi:hypothetical protein